MDIIEFIFILLGLVVSTGILWFVCDKASMALEAFFEERRLRWENEFPEQEYL